MLVLLFGLLVAAAVDLAQGQGNCDTEEVATCYATLVHYEGIGFPFYGKNEYELDQVCKTIDDAFLCVESFVQKCESNRKCGAKCEEMVNDTLIFTQNTGLRDLHNVLCSADSAMRDTYLENYKCLQSNAEHYAACHNDSQLSQDFMSRTANEDEAVLWKCCFLTWYHDCFTNITRNACNINATVFVSFSLHKLVGHITEFLCGDSPDRCHAAPMPDNIPDFGMPPEIDNDISNSLEKMSSNAVMLHGMGHSLLVLLCFLLLRKHLS